MQDIEKLFPGVEIQPKGLIATEAFVSVPLVGRPGAALSLRSHFFEFEAVSSTGAGGDRPGALRMAHQLERGGRYRVVVTTGGGLYRYQLRDEVAVVGFERGCPLLRFLGKADCVSDLVGEKLSEPQVRGVLERVFSSLDLSPDFALVVPIEGTPPGYCLYLQDARLSRPSHTVDGLARSFEEGLGENPYYRYAVSLGQLAPAQVRLLDQPGPSARARYERRCLELGQRLGDVKPTALDPRPGWAEVFAPSAAVRSLPPNERRLSGSPE